MNTLSLKNVNLDEIITQSDKLLTIKELLNIIDYDVSNLYIDRFWDSVEDDKWIYLDPDLILWMDYKDIKIGKEQIIKLLKKYFQEEYDYKILNNDEFEINDFCFGGLPKQNKAEERRGAHNKQYIVTSPDCFKELCMRVGTSKSDEIKKYYITLEKVFKFYLEYQSLYQKYQLENKDKELENIKTKLVDLSHHVFDFKELKKNTYIYIATNKHLASQNNYKIGVAKNLTMRRIGHNNTQNSNDKFYYTYYVQVHNAYTIEYMIKNILKDFKNSDSNEIYIIQHSYLIKIIKNIIENYQDCISYYNNTMKDYISNTYETEIPEKFEPYEKTKLTKEHEEPEEESKENTFYYNDNRNYGYIQFKNDNGKPEFKCLGCNYVFNRMDSLQNHYNRKVKCYEDPKMERVEEIRKQNDNPIVLEVDDNPEYTYYEKYNEETQTIEYYCNRCDYMTDNLNVLKKHYLKRQLKCYEEIRLKENEKREHIYKNNENYECEYYEYLQNNSTMYSCKYCDYTTTQKNYKNMMRHFDKKKKCYHKDYEELIEKYNMKYYKICTNNIKTYKCYFCGYESRNQQHVIRHLNSSKNKCIL